MPVYEYVARGFNVDPLWFGGGYGTLVGADPLDTRDDDASYAEASGSSQITFRPVALGAEAPDPTVTPWTSVTGELRWSLTAGERPHFITRFPTSVTDTSLNIDGTVTAGDGYHEYAFSYAPTTFTNPGFAMSDLWFVLGDGGTGSTWRATYFRLFVTAGDTYLRNHARDDGLGANAPRNHGATSKQGSLRNRGYR